MASEMSFSFPPYEVPCPKCGFLVKAQSQEIEAKAVFKCPRDNYKFPMGEVYDFYYARDPVVKESIDYLVRHSGRVKVTGGTSEERKKVTDFLNGVGIDKLTPEIFRELVMYGDVYLKIGRDAKGKPAGLTLLDPRNVRIEQGDLDTQRAIVTGRRLITAYVVNVGGRESKLSPDDVVHIKHGISFFPYGDPALRILLTHLLTLQFARGQSASLVESYENEVMFSLGLSPILLKKLLSKCSSSQANFIVETYLAHIKSLQSDVAHSLGIVTEELSEGGRLETPEISFDGPHKNRLLAIGGYNMSGLIESFRKAKQAGLITKEELAAVEKQLSGKE